MRKRIKKIQLKKGSDAQKSEVHKLTTNFIKWGYITTTENKAKYLKGIIDRLTHKAIKNSQADRNILTSALRDKKLVDYMTMTVAESFKNRVSGFSTVSKLPHRQGDAAKIAQVRWVVAIEQFMKLPLVDEKEKVTIVSQEKIQEVKK
ncbi:hypothetical protein A2690_03880 [Candidatus Roizmanbacteria bacterium RIFCSPHIGHO2_01_FULL_39_12b]|uniref:50S ribosomal protein L17 n=1 Tax=Candidatus Roizmanbacteria bacterium RIFCSPHIGHO2_01_FULL_39_12b TaxID=1802030 RepID=A0A1F7GBZ1_9BACT|nr:MAG: hypothetical protein A2690_03880 [Candidatus Roizmanbacteria bacterium RIFCSPHIGHO2_01_FULL_39_12b]OGK47080.1 MAG: hypothetical protein A3B46_01605 [Candidatus Roizmanbacteria bacterium RIFCSPLOWO2_01_FULL_39_19]